MPETASPPESSAGWRGGAAYAAYDAASAVAALFWVPLAPLLLGRGFAAGLGERLGGIPAAALGLDRPLWVHAASVGETLAARPLVAEIRRRRAGLPIVFSNTTATGRQVARTHLAPDAALLLPLDAWGIVDRAFARVRPSALIVVETEIWPGLLRAAERAAAPIVVVSGRVSERAFRRYGRFAPLFRAALGKVSAFGMQSEEDAERLIALGAPRQRVRVTGSLKAGGVPSGATSAADLVAGRTLLAAASTQPGEERVVLDAAAPFWNGRPELLLVLAPRRPERFDEVAQLVEASGLRYQRRSAMQHRPGQTTQVLVLDTLGELGGFLAAARAAFVGGTIAPVGGHNVLEPALLGKPVAFGPHTENVGGAARALLEAGGAEVVRSASDLTAFWGRCLDDPDWAARAGENARAAASGSSDAVARTWEMLAPYLQERA